MDSSIKNSILFLKKTSYYLIGIALLLVIWTICSIIFDEIIVPYPHKVIKNLFRILQTISIYKNLGDTIFRTLAGFLLAVIIGSSIGIISGLFLQLKNILFIPTIILQGSPPLLWIIPLMLILGTDGLAPIAVVFLVVLPLVIISTQEGMKTIGRNHWEMFKIYADSKSLILKELIIPSLEPHFKSILILGSVLALKSSIVGEWFGAKSGIGRVINEYFYTFNMLSFYTVSLLFILLVGVFAFASQQTANYFFGRNKDKGLKADYKPINPLVKKNSTALTINNLSFYYTKKHPVLNNINFHLKSGETAVLTGKSGCGKTTFAKIVCGLLKTGSANITLPANPCLIFQEDIFLPQQNCFKNASLPGRWKKTADLDDLTYHYLKLCGLEDYLDFFPDELSGGMKKRLTFARALILNPDFVVLDEPFNNLHKEARKNLWDLYFDLFSKNNIPSIIITHYPEELKNRNVVFYNLEDGMINKTGMI